MTPIPVTERLPDADSAHEVLVFDTDYQHWFFAVLVVAEHQYRYWRTAEGLHLTAVSHWMPEPPPPQ